MSVFNRPSKINKLYSIFFILSILFCCQKISCLENLKLELVQVLSRHGARTPLQVSLDFFGSPNRSLYEPWGIGQLTNIGKQGSYNLGLFLRNRYKDYLSTNYKPEEVDAYTSSDDYSKMSLASLVASLFPPSGSEIWNPCLIWSPVPFRSTAGDLDVLLKGYNTPKFLKLLNRVLMSDEHKRKFKKYADKLSSLNEKTGVKVTANISTLSYLFDILYSHEYAGINTSLPTWYTPEVKQTLLDVQELIFDDYVHNQEMRKIGIGLLVRTFVENMNLDQSKNNPRKIYLYSAHDTNLALFAKVHQIQDFKYPPFSSALILEKWRSSKNEVFVKLLDWRGVDNLSTLKLGNNSDLCPIRDYLGITKPVMISDNEVDDILKDFNVAQLRKFFFSDDVVMKSK